MTEKRTFFMKGFIPVFTAGLIWSFGIVPVRYITNAEEYQLQYLFYRGLTIAIILFSYLFIKEGIKFAESFKRIGKSSVFGALSLALAFYGFIFSITLTTVAVTMFMLALMPFIAGVIGFFTLKEKLSGRALLSMFLAMLGVLIMTSEADMSGSFWGLVIGFSSALGFAIFSVTLRWRPETPKFTTAALAGFFCSLIAISCIFIFDYQFQMPTVNIWLSVSHGTIVGSGLICYTWGAKYLPAAELTLLSLLEVVGGIFWAWLPFLGINEEPSFTIMLGGVVILFSVALHSLKVKKAQTPTYN